MGANELRIGDYVKFMLNNEDYEIISIDVKDLELIEKKQGVYEPIELTEEWLLKFGFVEKIDAYFYNDYCIEDIHNGVTWVISEFDHITDEFTAIGCGIKYVHQLQNLYFALTAKELTFKSE